MHTTLTPLTVSHKNFKLIKGNLWKICTIISSKAFSFHVNQQNLSLLKSFDKRVSCFFCLFHTSYENASSNNKKFLPLMVAYALSIHKCQGLTLPAVHIDCRNIFAPGQLSVALSRVKEVGHISLANFSITALPNQPQHVIEFLKSAPISFSDSCCAAKTLSIIPKVAADDVFLSSDNEGDDVTFDDNELVKQVLEQGSTESEIENENSLLGASQIIEKLLCCKEKSETQKSVNATVKNISETKMKMFADHCQEFFTQAYEKHCKEASDTKQMTAFEAECVEFLFLPVYHEALKKLFETENPNRIHQLIGSSTVSLLRDCFLDGKSRKTIVTVRTDPCEVSLTSKKKVYHLTGRCLFKMKKCYQRSMINNSRLITSNNISKWKNAESCLADLTQLESDVESSKDILGEIVTHTTAHEYFPGALTHPSQPFFNFAMQIEKKRHKYHCMEGLKTHKGNVFVKCKSSIIKDPEIQSMMRAMLPDSENANVICNMFCQKYLNIMSNQLRKEMRDRLNYEKKLAHRARHKGSANKPAVTYESIISSLDLVQCHSVIKEEVRKSNITFLQKFTIPQLIVIGYGYNLSLKKRQGKPAIMKHLASTILSAAGIANGTFKEQGVTCATAKRSKANKDEAYPCPKCKKPYDPKENSIYCNMCCGWLHQKCAKVTDEEWEELSNSEDHWFCDTCLAVG